VSLFGKARSVARQAKSSNKGRVTASVALFAVLVAVALVRRGSFPDPQGFAAIAGATIVVILLAQLLPEAMALLLTAAVVVTVVQDGGATVTRLWGQGVSAFQQAVRPRAS